MATVFLPPSLRELTHVSQAEVSAVTVREAVQQLELRFPGIAARLCAGNELSPTLQVSVDGVLSRRGLDAKLAPQSELHFLPIFGGG